MLIEIPDALAKKFKEATVAHRELDKDEDKLLHEMKPDELLEKRLALRVSLIPKLTEMKRSMKQARDEIDIIVTAALLK